MNTIYVECGGRKAQGLMIGSEPSTSDVLEKGLVQDLYKMDDWQLGTPHSDTHHHLETNRTKWKLYISMNNLKTESETASYGLHMSHPVLSVEHPNVVFASTFQIFTMSNSRRKRKYTYNDPSVVLREGEEIELSFFLFCLTKGESRVLVSIPLLHYDIVEFGFAKVCDHVPERHSGMAFSFSIMYAYLPIVFVAVVIAALSILKWKKGRNNYYRGVSSTEE